ncbi:MAG: type II secretion system F family protein [Deltaproteobacteria bacterium]|nr:type II secretion system F family protein [Deltaproteobacteria bacterium]
MVFVVAMAAGLRALLGRRDEEVVERIERSTAAAMSMSSAGGNTGTSDGASEDSYVPALARILRPLSWLARPVKSDELARLRGSLLRGGYRGDHAMEIFLGVKLVTTPIVTIAFLLVNSRLPNPIKFPTDAGLAFMLAALTFFLPNLWLRGRISERQTAIERALPDAMDLLVTCVEAGLGLDAAIARVAEEMTLAAPLLAEELRHTYLEIQAGVPRADGFRRLAERTGVEDLRALSAILIQTDMFGTSIARALRVQSESMRIRRAQRAEEKAAMVSVKMTIPLIMCILPSLIAVVMGPAIAMIVRNFSGQP